MVLVLLHVKCSDLENQLKVKERHVLYLPARASEQGNVIGSVRIYIYIYIYIYIQCILGYPNLDYPNPRLSEPPK